MLVAEYVAEVGSGSLEKKELALSKQVPVVLSKCFCSSTWRVGSVMIVGNVHSVTNSEDVLNHAHDCRVTKPIRR